MGSGGTKTHESFAIAPAATTVVSQVDPPPAAPTKAAVPQAAEPDVPPTAAVGPAGLDDQALTPIPGLLPAGLVTGVPILAGGADLEDSLVTLTSYASNGGPHEVLTTRLTPQAEEKVLAALATETPQVPVQSQVEVTGQLPVDLDQHYYDRLLKVAKSVNHHLKAGDGMPTHTIAAAKKLTDQLTAVAGDQSVSDEEHTMAAHYLGHLAAVHDRLAGDVPPYAEGGKLPQVTPYETHGLVTVTTLVPDPGGVPPGRLPTTSREATRIRPTLDPDGTARWNGTSRRKVPGSEYVADLGDGYTAFYRPHEGEAQVPYSYRGTLEITAPAGAGHGRDLVDRLGQLNLVNRALTAQEGEWAYLQRQVVAQNLGISSNVKTALTAAAGLDDAMEHLVLAERANQAAGLDHASLHRFAAAIRVEAEARALPAKVRLVRDAVAHATGHADGATLLAHPRYDPTPTACGGWLTWNRFDVVPAAVSSRFGKRGLSHRLHGGGSLLSMLRTGVLASTERRASMGLPAGLGMSEEKDQDTGGARSVFLRVGHPPGQGPALHWDDPSVLLRRADWYAYPADHFGSLNPASGKSTNGLTRSPAKVAGFTGSQNEVMIGNGIDLLGAEAPSRIVCASGAERDEVLKLLGERGITQLRGVSIEKVVRA